MNSEQPGDVPKATARARDPQLFLGSWASPCPLAGRVQPALSLPMTWGTGNVLDPRLVSPRRRCVHTPGTRPCFGRKNWEEAETPTGKSEKWASSRDDRLALLRPSTISPALPGPQLAQ